MTDYKLGQRVVETSPGSCFYGRRGTVVESSVLPGELAIRWDDDREVGLVGCTTSITHGAIIIEED